VTDPATAIRRLDDVPLNTALAIRQAMTASLLLIEADARQLAPRDQRRLAGSITHRVEGYGLEQEGHVGPSVQPSYGAAVEFGRRAGARMPPVDALMGWVTRHWRGAVVGRPGRQHGQRVLPGFERELSQRITNKRRPPRAITEKQIRRRAFGLALAIRRRGIPPNPYMRPAFYKNQAAVLNEFRLVGRRVAASIAGEALG
jgi:hypothetical protein